MNLWFTKSRLQALAVDEMAVVLYLRLLINVIPACVLGSGIALGLLELGRELWPSMDFSFNGAALLWGSITVYCLWFVCALRNVRNELLHRPKAELQHTPTFYTWARFTQVFAVISIARPVLKVSTNLNDLLIWITGMAWVLSCLMAGFYIVYFILIALVKQWPPMTLIRAFLLACASAFFPPAIPH